jgi:hypothetical protein
MIFPGKPDTPGNKSGVTLGPGYDLGNVNVQTIADTLTRIGVDPTIAKKLEREAGGLRGQAAYNYVQKNGEHGTKLICLTERAAGGTAGRISAPIRTACSTPYIESAHSKGVRFYG